MIKRLLAGMAVILALTACDPEKGSTPPPNNGGQEQPAQEQPAQIPGVNASITTIYVLAHAYLDGVPKTGASALVTGTLIGVNHEKVQVTEGEGCKKNSATSMICGLPTSQQVDMTGVVSVVFTFSLSTNAKGWQLGCEISTNKHGAAGILDQHRSDRTSGTKTQTIATTCSFP
jgi:hypothetical protein